MYKGFRIEVFKNSDREYPFIASCYIGNELVNKKGYDEEQAIKLVEAVINFTLLMIERKGFNNNQ